MSVSFRVNGKSVTSSLDPQTPLMWVLRDELGLTGTKYGCGIAVCGACTVHVNGEAVRSCTTPVSAIAGKKVTTIEGLASDRIGRAVQDAWVANNVPQCGYCQSGQCMSAAALLKAKPKPTDADIDTAMSGNLCRCGCYGRIRESIKQAAAKVGGAA
ncbi:aerobic-type carbon monoxide dehydrogenase, small subunit CoxS/CutS-like protein [Burkholderiales bacterium JOSHI_001]|nr:aerobic-type carbon monoxide dehydrogenase, small subunit CoxS/CutS-like protein [Burkholderiales bacterium JOSHI_001]